MPRALPVVAALMILPACRGEAGPDAGPVVGPPPSELANPTPGAGDRRVLGRGTITDVGDGPVLCVGAVEESAPPQCSGVRVVGLDVASPSVASLWNGRPSRGWSDELVLVGTYDGDALTLTDDPMSTGTYSPTIPLIPRDPATMPPPQLDQAELTSAAREVRARLRPPAAASVVDGHVVADVAFDDGSLQAELDREHGRDVVVVHPALMSIGG